MASYSDNFDRADGELGASWTVDAGDIHVSSNVAVPQTADATNRARYASALASANHRVIATVGRINGVSARQDSATDTCYIARVTNYDNGSGYKLYKHVNGTETQIGSAQNLVTSGAIRITLTVDGSTISMKARVYSGGWVDDVEVISVTDTTITTGTYAGLHGYHNIGTIDGWSAEDLAAGGPSIPVLMYMRRQQ